MTLKYVVFFIFIWRLNITNMIIFYCYNNKYLYNIMVIKFFKFPSIDYFF